MKPALKAAYLKARAAYPSTSADQARRIARAAIAPKSKARRLAEELVPDAFERDRTGKLGPWLVTVRLDIDDAPDFSYLGTFEWVRYPADVNREAIDTVGRDMDKFYLSGERSRDLCLFTPQSTAAELLAFFRKTSRARAWESLVEQRKSELEAARAYLRGDYGSYCISVTVAHKAAPNVELGGASLGGISVDDGRESRDYLNECGAELIAEAIKEAEKNRPAVARKLRAKAAALANGATA